MQYVVFKVVQGKLNVTVNGIGERAGNTAIEEIVMTLKTRNDLNFETNINTKKINEISKLVQKITGFNIQPNKAVVGGMHFCMNLEFIRMVY